MQFGGLPRMECAALGFYNTCIYMVGKQEIEKWLKLCWTHRKEATHTGNKVKARPNDKCWTIQHVGCMLDSATC